MGVFVFGFGAAIAYAAMRGNIPEGVGAIVVGALVCAFVAGWRLAKNRAVASAVAVAVAEAKARAEAQAHAQVAVLLQQHFPNHAEGPEPVQAGAVGARGNPAELGAPGWRDALQEVGYEVPRPEGGKSLGPVVERVRLDPRRADVRDSHMTEFEDRTITTEAEKH